MNGAGPELPCTAEPGKARTKVDRRRRGTAPRVGQVRAIECDTPRSPHGTLVTDEEVLVVGVAGEMNFDFIEDMASVGKTFPPVQSLPVLLRYRYRKRWWVGRVVRFGCPCVPCRVGPGSPRSFYLYRYR